MSMAPSEKELEKLTTEELAKKAYLDLISIDDSIPDLPRYDDGIRALGALWARLRPVECQIEGCSKPHTKSFPWCIDHLRERAEKEGRA